MFRRLLVALLFVLPAQFLWAAVAPYCAHEAAPATFHLGHHAHKHAAGSADPASAVEQAEQSDLGTGAASLEHPDCGQCHASHAQFGLAGRVPAASPPHGRLAGPPHELYSSRIEQNIDRPKWTHAR